MKYPKQESIDAARSLAHDYLATTVESIDKFVKSRKIEVYQVPYEMFGCGRPAKCRICSAVRDKNGNESCDECLYARGMTRDKFYCTRHETYANLFNGLYNSAILADVFHARGEYILELIAEIEKERCHD